MQQQDSTAMPPPPSYTKHEVPVATTPSDLISREQPRQLPAELPRELPTGISTDSTNAPTQYTAATDSYAPDRPPSPSPSTATSLPPYERVTYRGFPSEEAYLEALKEWAEEKKFIQPSSEDAQMLAGFYGSKTMDEYAGPARRPKIRENGEEKKSFWRRVRESKST